MHITLVGCGHKKDPEPDLLPASSRYTSPLFQKSLAFARRHSDHVVIVSAKHGMVLTEQLVAPYDERLDPRKALDWAEDVINEIQGTFGTPTGVFIMAGADYAKPLRKAIEASWPDAVVEEPLAGMSIGNRLRFLNDHDKVCTKLAQNQAPCRPCPGDPSPAAKRAALRERARKTVEEVKALVAFDMGTTNPPDWRPFLVDLAEVVAELLEVES